MITVGIPTYNCVDYICESIESALNQPGVDIEVLVYDDASTDDTFSTIQYIFGNRIKIIQGKNNIGLGAARNQLIAQASGQYIIFLDSDDLLLPGSLAKLRAAITGYEIAFGMVEPFCNIDGKRIIPRQGRDEWLNEAVKKIKNSRKLTYELAQIAPAWGKLISLPFLRKNGVRCSEIRYMEDCLFAYLLAFSNPRYTVIDDVVQNIRQHEKSMSASMDESKFINVMLVTKELIENTRSQPWPLKIRLLGNNLVYFLSYQKQNPEIFEWTVKHKHILSLSQRLLITLKLLKAQKEVKYCKLL